MLMVIDIGNTRTKWAEVADNGSLIEFGMSPNITLAQSPLKNRLAEAEKVIIANVAGDAMAEQIVALMPSHVKAHFVIASAEACHVTNQYQQSEALGVDRWAAAIAVWHQYKQPAIVVCAGTAITIDSISINATLKTALFKSELFKSELFKSELFKSTATKKGLYLGGAIMPGLYLMQDALANNTSKLANVSTGGNIKVFPDNTSDAIQTGCMNAVTGAILLASKQLEKHCAFLPKVIITGGDAVRIANALKVHLKSVVVEDNLVLQGLALLEKDEV